MIGGFFFSSPNIVLIDDEPVFAVKEQDGYLFLTLLLRDQKGSEILRIRDNFWEAE